MLQIMVIFKKSETLHFIISVINWKKIGKKIGRYVRMQVNAITLD